MNLLKAVQAIAIGVYRCILLMVLVGVIPAFAITVCWYSASFALLTFSDRSVPGPLHDVIRVVVVSFLTVLWTATAVWLVLVVSARPLAKATRHLVFRWFNIRLESAYNPAPVPTPKKLATGYWWSGYDYCRWEWQARLHARSMSRHRINNPQFGLDVRWLGVGSVTVLPVVCFPIFCMMAGIYTLSRPGFTPWGVSMIVIALSTAPFGWVILRPLALRFLGSTVQTPSAQRVAALESLNADLTQAQANELERIERELHDGTQARIVALGLSLGAAEKMVDSDPDAVKALLRQARSASTDALAELRDLVRGINPPILADRGLVDAVRALALDGALEVVVRAEVPARPERPIESAVYFAVAELLANAQKHAHASKIVIDLRYESGILRATVTDNGGGGAVISRGGGLAGIERRLTVFGGRFEIESPNGGPTNVRIDIPCVLS